MTIVVECDSPEHAQIIRASRFDCSIEVLGQLWIVSPRQPDRLVAAAMRLAENDKNPDAYQVAYQVFILDRAA